MNHSRTRCTTCRRQIFEMKQQTMNDRSCFRSGPGMDHHPSRLLDDGQIFIFKIDLERQLLSCERYRLDALEIHIDGFPSTDAITGFVLAAFHTDRPGPIEHLNLRARYVFQALSQKDIKTQPLVVRTGEEF